MAMVTMRMPMVARMRGLGSPTASRHSLLMNCVTSAGKLPRCAFTLFFRIRPDSDLKMGENKHVISRIVDPDPPGSALI